MKILVLNGAYRPGGTTTELARIFMEGAKSAGAEADMIMLRDKKIAYCTNCLKCYSFEGQGIAPCSLSDDMDDIIARMADADGVLFASPVHNGFVSGLMAVFWERLAWRIIRPAERFIGAMGMRSRIDGKVRAVGAISSAGGMPSRLRRFCDDGTPWLKSNSSMVLHAQWIDGLYMGADLERMPRSADEWRRIYFLRRLGESQREQAHGLGVKMANAIKSGRLTPTTIDNLIPAPVRWVMELISALSPPYRIAR